MKVFSSLSLLLFAGVASAQYKCSCTGANTNPVTNNCCGGGNGITFPDGSQHRGVVLNSGESCQYSGLGQFNKDQFTSSFGACCDSTGGTKNGAQCS
ncbi:hypothetical protein CKAH01_11901 [Colletotrichum kahawae]|uniref:Uncharacterized protein n=1 Tax=Colletotrichum kahawae TaxID=34407 RepID=A0AAD9YUT1_COLKA|nr:hypothetical protein CKAH01_11901 [Colletotrichum kahawae]